ncbi:hypothetical protein [Leifsonia aquatica]|nr:hypothetical protein [Leifsonia aquatica]MBB2967929.1 hypothetical protein [Leifsonia aquatica]
MADYKPHLDADLWGRIQPFVNSVVRQAEGLTPYTDRELYVIVTPLAAWMRTRAGLPLENGIAFDPNIIDRFVMDGLSGYTKAGRGTMRSRLRRLSEALLPDSDEPARERPLGKSEPSRPYTDAQITSLHSWAHALPGQVGKNADRLLALGFGAGLVGTEFGLLHVADLERLNPGILVHVPGDRRRDVPVTHEWEPALIDCAATCDDGDYVFRIGRQTTHRNVITNFVERHRPPIPLQARRMRATWIVNHLSAATPAVLIIQAAGLSSAEGLDPFLPYAKTPADPTQILRLTSELAERRFGADSGARSTRIGSVTTTGVTSAVPALPPLGRP